MFKLKNLKKNKGFTLAEIVVVVAILGLIVTVIASFQVNVMNYNRSSSISLQSAQDARAIVGTMVKEIRAAKQSSNGSYAISQATQTALTFFSDIDADGLQEQIRYYISSGILKKGVTKPSGNPPTYNLANEKTYILAYNIVNTVAKPLFKYYDNSLYISSSTSSLSQPVDVSDIRLVQINLSLNPDPNRFPDKTYISDATFRNLKDNL